MNGISVWVFTVASRWRAIANANILSTTYWTYKFWFASTGKLIVLTLTPSKALQTAPHIFMIPKFHCLDLSVFFSFSAKIQMEEVR